MSKKLEDFSFEELIAVRDHLLNGRGVLSLNMAKGFFKACDDYALKKESVSDDISKNPKKKIIKGNDPSPYPVSMVALEALKKWNSENNVLFSTFFNSFLKRQKIVPYNTVLLFDSWEVEINKMLKALARKKYPDLDEYTAIRTLLHDNKEAIRTVFRQHYKHDVHNDEFIDKKMTIFLNDYATAYEQELPSFDDSASEGEEERISQEAVWKSTSEYQMPGEEEKEKDNIDKLQECFDDFYQNGKFTENTLVSIAIHITSELVKWRLASMSTDKKQIEFTSDDIRTVLEGYSERYKFIAYVRPIFFSLYEKKQVLPKDIDIAEMFGIGKTDFANRKKRFVSTCKEYFSLNERSEKNE